MKLTATFGDQQRLGGGAGGVALTSVRRATLSVARAWRIRIARATGPWWGLYESMFDMCASRVS